MGSLNHPTGSEKEHSSPIAGDKKNIAASLSRILTATQQKLITSPAGQFIKDKFVHVHVEKAALPYYIGSTLPILGALSLSKALHKDRNNISITAKVPLMLAAGCGIRIIGNISEELFFVLGNDLSRTTAKQLLKESGPIYLIGSSSYKIGMRARVAQEVSRDTFQIALKQALEKLYLRSQTNYQERTDTLLLLKQELGKDIKFLREERRNLLP